MPAPQKRILSSTMDAVRQRLAPIRGIPTKAGGMQVRAPPSLVHHG